MDENNGNTSIIVAIVAIVVIVGLAFVLLRGFGTGKTTTGTPSAGLNVNVGGTNGSAQ